MFEVSISKKEKTRAFKFINYKQVTRIILLKTYEQKEKKEYYV